MNRFLTRDQILAAEDLAREIVDVPEWGEGAQVLVRELTAAEREQHYYLMIGDDDTVDVQKAVGFRQRLCVWCIIDEDGEHLFTQADVEALGRKNTKVVDRIADVVRRLSGLAEETEELAKNSESGQESDSPTD